MKKTGSNNKNFEKVIRKTLTKIKNGKDHQGYFSFGLKKILKNSHLDYDDPEFSQEYVEGVIDQLCENMNRTEGWLLDWRNNVKDLVKVITWNIVGNTPLPINIK